MTVWQELAERIKKLERLYNTIRSTVSPNIPIYTNNASALAAGLTPGKMYRLVDGTLMTVFTTTTTSTTTTSTTTTSTSTTTTTTTIP
jgi:hypothetical protein